MKFPAEPPARHYLANQVSSYDRRFEDSSPCSPLHRNIKTSLGLERAQQRHFPRASPRSPAPLKTRHPVAENLKNPQRCRPRSSPNRGTLCKFQSQLQIPPGCPGAPLGTRYFVPLRRGPLSPAGEFPFPRARCEARWGGEDGRGTSSAGCACASVDLERRITSRGAGAGLGLGHWG